MFEALDVDFGAGDVGDAEFVLDESVDVGGVCIGDNLIHWLKNIINKL